MVRNELLESVTSIDRRICNLRFLDVIYLHITLDVSTKSI